MGYALRPTHAFGLLLGSIGWVSGACVTPVADDGPRCPADSDSLFPGVGPIAKASFDDPCCDEGAIANALDDPCATYVCVDGGWLDYGLCPLIEVPFDTVGCFPYCLADLIENTERVEPNCGAVIETADHFGVSALPECVPDVIGWVVPPDSESDVCFHYLVDPGGQTPTPDDDAPAECVAGGVPAAFSVETRNDFQVDPSWVVMWGCQWDLQPTPPCPPYEP